MPKIMTPLGLVALDKEKDSGEDNVNASNKASKLISFSQYDDQR